MVPDNKYRERLEHEFDENPFEYESKVRDAVSESLYSVDDEEFVRQYAELPEPTDKDREIEDNEALEGYRHIANGEWNRLNRGQVICLYRHLKAIQEKASEQGPAYHKLEKNVDELDYVLTLESQLDRTEQRYTIDDEE